MSIGSKGTVIKLFSAETVFPFQTQIGEINVKRILATSAYEQQGGKHKVMKLMRPYLTIPYSRAKKVSK